jgi:hypothetical protein
MQPYQAGFSECAGHSFDGGTRLLTPISSNFDQKPMKMPAKPTESVAEPLQYPSEGNMP